MQEEQLPINTIWDSKLFFIFLAVVCAGSAAFFFRIAGEYALTILFGVWFFADWLQERRNRARLEKELTEKNEKIKSLKLENSTLKRLSNIKEHLTK